MEIEVEDTEYKKARAPNELYSGGLGPCIAIGAIYEKRGYMIHHHPVTSEQVSSVVRSFFADLQRVVKNKEKLKIYVAGGSIGVDDECPADMEAWRQNILTEITQNGYQKCIEEIRWCPPNFIQSLKLIISEGRAEIEEDSEAEVIAELYGNTPHDF